MTWTSLTHHAALPAAVLLGLLGGCAPHPPGHAQGASENRRAAVETGGPKNHPTAEATPIESFDVVETSIDELQAAMQSGAVTSRGLVQLYVARIQAYDQQGPALNAMITMNPEALAEA